MLYILNSPVMTSYGLWQYEPISVLEAKKIIDYHDGEFTSAIGHESTAKLLSELLEEDIQVNRIKAELKVGDHAIVFILKTRAPELKIYTKEELMNMDWELGLITKSLDENELEYEVDKFIDDEDYEDIDEDIDEDEDEDEDYEDEEF